MNLAPKLFIFTFSLLVTFCFSLNGAFGQEPLNSPGEPESCGEAVSRDSNFEIIRGESDEFKRIGIVNRLLALDEMAPGGVGRDEVLRIIRDRLLYVVFPHDEGRVLILKNRKGLDVGYLAYVEKQGIARVFRISTPGRNAQVRNSKQARLMASIIEKLQKGELDAIEFDFDLPVITSDISHFIERLKLRHLEKRETWEPNVWSLTRETLARAAKHAQRSGPVFEPMFFGAVVEKFPVEHISDTVDAFASSIQLGSSSYQALLRDLETRLRKPGVFFLLTRGDELVAVAVGEQARAGQLIISDMIWFRKVTDRDSALTALLWEILRHADNFALDTQVKILDRYAHVAEEVGLTLDSAESHGQGVVWKTYQYSP